MSKTRLEYADEAKKHEESLLALRRDFHRHPELSLHETRTAEIIAERLQAAGLEVRSGIGGGTGVVGVLHGDQPGRTVAWRADIDALPIEEVPDLPFKSIHPGVMHACGHDGHTAIAITLAEILAARRAEWPGTVVFIFQPAEEVFGGARVMIEAGVLDDPPVEKVYGIHLTTLFPAGMVGVRSGPTLASVDFFDIEVKGKGGHGAFPHLSVDPITAAAHILVGMQNLVAREVAASEAAIVSVGEIKSGSQHNIIPDTALMRGSIRSFQAPVRDQLVERLGAYASRMAQAYQAEAHLTLVGEFCPAVVNSEEEAGFIRQCACEELGADKVIETPPVMASDDMSLFLQARPGCYFWVGAAPVDKEARPHHSAEFEISEEGVSVGLRMGLSALLNSLIEDL